MTSNLENLKDKLFTQLANKLLSYDEIIEKLKQDMEIINKKMNMDNTNNSNIINYLIQRNEYLEHKIRKIQNTWV